MVAAAALRCTSCAGKGCGWSGPAGLHRSSRRRPPGRLDELGGGHPVGRTRTSTLRTTRRVIGHRLDASAGIGEVGGAGLIAGRRHDGTVQSTETAPGVTWSFFPRRLRWRPFPRRPQTGTVNFMPEFRGWFRASNLKEAGRPAHASPSAGIFCRTSSTGVDYRAGRTGLSALSWPRYPLIRDETDQPCRTMFHALHGRCGADHAAGGVMVRNRQTPAQVNGDFPR